MKQFIFAFILMISLNSFSQKKSDYFSFYKLLALLYSDSYKNDQKILNEFDYKVTEYNMNDAGDYFVTFSYAYTNFVGKILISYYPNKIIKDDYLPKDIMLLITTLPDNKTKYEEDFTDFKYKYSETLYNKGLKKMFDIYENESNIPNKIQFSSTYLKSKDELLMYNLNIVYVQNY